MKKKVKRQQHNNFLLEISGVEESCEPTIGYKLKMGVAECREDVTHTPQFSASCPLFSKLVGR